MANRLLSDWKNAKSDLDEMQSARKARGRAAELFLKEISKRKAPLDEFDEQLWYARVDVIAVRADGALVFRFKDGTEIEG